MTSLRAPYGTWDSPITAEAIAKAGNTTSDIVVDQVTSEVYHLESRPTEDGRRVLVHTASNRDVVDSKWNIRTAVQEYGGAAAIVHDSVVYFSHIVDGRIYMANVGPGAEPEAITPENVPYRYACLEPHPTRPDLLFSVLEDHTKDTPAEVVTSIVVINTIQKRILPVLSGTDFYASPKVSPDGKRLAWIQWAHPDMPWEGGEVHVGDISIPSDNAIQILEQVHVAGSLGKVGAGYPAWANDDTLIFTTDESGYANPWKYSQGKATPLFPKPIPEDFAEPMWMLNWFPYAIVDEAGKTGLFTAWRDGRNILYLVDLESQEEPRLLETPYVVMSDLRTASRKEQKVVFIGRSTKDSDALVSVSFTPSSDEAAFVVLKSSPWMQVGGIDLPKDIVSEPQPITLTKPSNNESLYVVYYPPHNPKYSGSSVSGEKPPCMVQIHGGPTHYSEQGLSWEKQYFTSRGWGWLDVNYGGSSGFGRKYIERLVGTWGIEDVQDCILGPKSLSEAPYNIVDPKRLIIRGESSGGFCVLAALSTAPDVTTFAAATSLFGISDLNKLAEFTHKFESQYMFHLLGGTPDEVPEVYHDRSPINYADKIVVPLLILQGEDDKVVPKGQAEAIYNSIKSRGGVVEYKLYPGEGHGWLQESTIRDALERELGFYERVFGLKQ